MTLEVTKTVTVKETVDVTKLLVIRGGQRDADSENITVHYNNKEIADGHLNNRTNWAHITMLTENEELESYLVDAIENRKITIK